MDWLRQPDDGFNFARVVMHQLGIEEDFDDPVWAVSIPLFRRFSSDEELARLFSADQLDALFRRALEEARELMERAERREQFSRTLPSRDQRLGETGEAPRTD